MAELPQRAAIDALVSEVVDRASTRLAATAADAKARQADLAKAGKQTANRMRTDEVKAAIVAEQTLAADADALGRSVAQVRSTMADDLERLLTLAVGER